MDYIYILWRVRSSVDVDPVLRNSISLYIREILGWRKNFNFIFVTLFYFYILLVDYPFTVVGPQLLLEVRGDSPNIQSFTDCSALNPYGTVRMYLGNCIRPNI